MLTYEQALARILREVSPAAPVKVKLEEALGLVLAHPITARFDLPLFNNSAVDGYAIRSQDVSPSAAEDPPSHVSLRVIGKAEAGRPFCASVRKDEAIRILTGAQVPQGANAVVMQEHVIRRNGQLIIQRLPKAGQNIRRRSEDLCKGARILKTETLIRPQEIGLLAALGSSQIPVYPRPTVAILTTGDELKPPGSHLKAGEIYESNGALLHALLREAGASSAHLGIVRDVITPLIRKIRRGLGYDILLICGGASVGEKDLLRKATQACGIREIFWRVNIKPGMPLFFGKHRDTFVFGLPGNPISVYVCFEEFVKPAIAKLSGRSWSDPYQTCALLAKDLKLSPTRRTHFVRLSRLANNGRMCVEPLDAQGSHQLRSLTEADAWTRLVSDEGPWRAGTLVRVKPVSGGR